MTWKHASLVFRGGTREARALKGKKIRSITMLYGVSTIGSDGQSGIPTDIAIGAEGFVGFVPETALDEIRICFSKDRTPANSLEAMMRSGRITVIQVNWGTFKHAFEIDV